MHNIAKVNVRIEASLLRTLYRVDKRMSYQAPAHP